MNNINEQIKKYMDSFGNFGDFKIDPSQGVEASKKIVENNVATFKEILELSSKTFQKVGEMAQKNISSAVDATKKVKLDDISSLDASDIIQGAVDNNQKILTEVQNSQANIQKIVTNCVNKNLDEISKKSPKKKAA